MPLAMADMDKEYVIKFIRGNDKTISHLNDLGFVVGGTVKVVSQMAGNLIVQVKESRVAIDKSMASRIILAV